jgi:hypothetical protein
MLYVSLLLAGVLFVVANGAVRSSGKPYQVTVITGLALSIAPIFLMAFIPVVPLQLLLLCAVMPFCLGTPRHSARFLVLSLVATFGAFTPFIVMGLNEQREYAELRKQFPFESIEERLPPDPPLAAGELTTAAQQNLSTLETAIERRGQSWRPIMLKKLHEDTTSLFVASPGFGAGRMAMASRPSKYMLERDLRRDNPIPQPGSSLPLPRSIDRPPEETNVVLPSGGGSLHEISVLDFVYPQGFGYIKDRQRVAGFQAHGFSSVPTEQKIEIESIELVGLLHGEPRVYQSPNLPRMDELKSAPTRSLDAFENSGLATLRRGEDLFTRPENGGIRMLGSIRSAKQCVSCHGGQRGDLLGAFSYVLKGKAN